MHQRLGQAARPHCKLMSQIFHGWMNGRTALASWYITLVADSMVFLAEQPTFVLNLDYSFSLGQVFCRHTCHL